MGLSLLYYVGSDSDLLTTRACAWWFLTVRRGPCLVYPLMVLKGGWLLAALYNNAQSKPARLTARAALNMPHANLAIPYIDLKYYSKKLGMMNRMMRGANKSVQLILGEWQSYYRRSRRDEDILSFAYWSYILDAVLFWLGTIHLSVSTASVQ